jgi:hypothetical protein
MRNHQYTVVHIYNHAFIINDRISYVPYRSFSSNALGSNHECRADKSRPRFPVKRVFLCLSRTFIICATPNEMSSSIPLAYLGVRKESEAPSIGRTSRRISSDQAPGDSRQSPASSANSEIEPHENTNDIVPSIEFEEGGYGWVVTGCKLPNQTENKT